MANWPELVIERLANGHRVIALDLFGMGFSERNDDFPYGFALWSRQLVSVLDILGIERASPIGHSLGGTVVIFFAANYPDRVDRIVLAGSAISIPWWFPVLVMPGSGELFLASQDVFGPTFSPTHRAQAVAAYQIRGTRAALLRYVRHSILEAGDVLPAVGAVRAKALQLHGTADEEVPFSAAERLQTQLQDSRLVPIPEAGHFVMVDAPERFASEVETFLRSQ